jgi:hypothetical protein
MNKIASIAPRSDAGPRYIDPNTPITKQVQVLDQLRKNPPENSRRVAITPELAEHILINCQDVNRPRRTNAVKQYGADMQDGKWRLTGDTIKFGKSGFLRDGQHRLAGCVRAGVVFETYMLFGLDDDAFAVMDIGRKRDGSDTFTLAGVPHASSASAAARWDKILTGPEPGNRAQSFSNRELLEHYKTLNTKRFDAAVSDAKKACRGQRVVHESPLAALVYLYRTKHATAVDTFLVDLAARKRGAKKLVDLLGKLKDQSLGRVHETQRNAILINALNAYATGKRVSEDMLKWTEASPFPRFV